MIQRRFFPFILAIAILFLTACSPSKAPATDANQQALAQESREAKNLLQGIWVDEETEEVTFRAQGDTLFYPDTISQPAYFKIVKDTLYLGSECKSYHIVKQSEHVFWFESQSGDIMKLQKSDDPIHVFAFVHDKPQVMTYTEVVKTDSVVAFEGERYHWYLAINPTKYKVHVVSYNNGVETDNIYYDNIMHVSVFQGSRKFFSTDFKKQLFASKIPQQFLEKAVLSNMEFTKVDQSGFHFIATICVPDGAACYKAENVISFEGQLTTTLIEY